MKIRYEPMPNRVPGVYAVWLIDGTPLPWLVGYSHATDDRRWVSRRRDDGEPIPGFPRQSDAAAFLAAGGMVQMPPSPPSSHRPGRRDCSAGPGGVGMSRRIELHGPLRDQVQMHAEQRADRAMESANPNMAGRLLHVADLAQASGLALGMLEGVT